MDGWQPTRDGVPEQVDLLAPDAGPIEPDGLRGRLLDLGCGTDPICVIGHEGDGDWVEVYERETRSPADSAPFVGHFVLPGQGEYLVLLDDLTEWLQHPDRLARAFGLLASAGTRGDAGMARPPRAAARRHGRPDTPGETGLGGGQYA